MPASSRVSYWEPLSHSVPEARQGQPLALLGTRSPKSRKRWGLHPPWPPAHPTSTCQSSPPLLPSQPCLPSWAWPEQGWLALQVPVVEPPARRPSHDPQGVQEARPACCRLLPSSSHLLPSWAAPNGCQYWPPGTPDSGLPSHPCPACFCECVVGGPCPCWPSPGDGLPTALSWTWEVCGLSCDVTAIQGMCTGPRQLPPQAAHGVLCKEPLVWLGTG